MRFARLGCAQSGRASSRHGCDRMTVFRPEWKKHAAGCGKTAEFRKSFTLAGGQRQSRQRIVRMREYSTRAAGSRGRAFGSIRATASTCSSGLLPLLHGAYLSFAAGIHPPGAFRRRCRLENASIRRPEDCGPPLGASRHGMPQARRRRQGDVHRQAGGRPRLPACPGGFRVRGDGCRDRRRPGVRSRRGTHGQARGACPSVEFFLTAARSFLRSPRSSRYRRRAGA